MKKAAVITADLVASRELDKKEREQLFKAIRSALKKMVKEKWIDAFELYRGDSFQCVLPQKELALRTALLLRTYVRSYNILGKQDLKLSIGIGSLDFYRADNIAQSDGQAFWLSGTELDNMKKSLYRMSLKTPDPQFNENIEPSILLLDAVMQKWTGNQAEVIYHKLQSLKEEEISRIIGISQSAVNQRIHTAQWFAVDKLLTYFEKNVTKAIV